MHAVNRIAGETLKQPIFQHGERAAAAFFPRLEDEMDNAVEIAGLRQVFGGPQQHGGMAIMPAGMHRPLHRAAIGDIIQFFHRQRIHIGAQPNGAIAGTIAEHANHARTAHAAMHLNPKRFQGGSHLLRRAEFRHAEFRMGMQVTPEGGEFGLVAADGINWGHGGLRGLVSRPSCLEAARGGSTRA